jgi:uridine phosphorylase
LAGATLAIVPGDPGRVARIAQHLDDVQELAASREFTSVVGRLDGVPIVVCSTGIGGPSTSIAMEELAQRGITTFLRVGTTGSIQPDLPIGHLVVTQASVRLDGASRHFAPMEYPAASDFFCTQALVDAAAASGASFRVGITASSDTFYDGQERYQTVAGAVSPWLQGSRAEWQRLGVLNYEMESATLLTMAAANGWRAGCVAAVIAQRTESEQVSEPAQLEAAEALAISVVLDGARRLLAA